MQRSIFYFPVLAFLLSCSEPTIMLTPLSQEQPILAFGDSLTFGYGASTTQSYPAQLSELINISIINAGINGELSRDGLARLDALLALHKPQLLLLCHGANDMIQKRDLTLMAENLKEMIGLARERKIQVVLIAVPRPGLILSPFAQYQQVADDMRVVIENDIITDTLQQPKYHSDLIHPNGLGYQQIAQAIANLLEKHGALNL
ncbi:MAG: acyl-CoA thioesterase-1 [Psychromonas sp.]|jgi:acyl-CoA thioesterase-1|uniref:GDSL-type esterase/lipase family protein n=1 Tax=Psychromonas sp. TaxID=1884585 RepID=UPI0039E35A46